MSANAGGTPVLVIDDEPQIRRLIQLTLESSGFKVYEAETGGEGLARSSTDRPEAVVLDLGLPDMDGTEVLKAIRARSTVPVLILSVRSGEEDVISCLNAGADDYLMKPFRQGELVARVKAAIRHRQRPEEKGAIVAGPVTIDLDARVVRRAGEIVKLTGTEYALLALFVRNAGRVLTHKYILEQVWGPAYAEESQYTRVYVGQLRKKLEDDPSNPTLIVTESGIGYRFAR
ncbi:MAG TPA: response regulator [Bacteroidota bacterium]|nr:response regulator [Bacteroidota bacterium]